jgi:hypothetical protein
MKDLEIITLALFEHAKGCFEAYNKNRLNDL